ncbi:MAG: hypothetical protein HKN56_10345, partial [Gammaproteobacteria bacterium]|nr:hypothetical protein [Gammaproteobacteria bacterium]
MTFQRIGLPVILVIAAFFATPAKAASVSYYLDQSNDLANGTNYAIVTIEDGVGGDIDFT